MKLEDLLKSKNLRITKQRRLILDYIEKKDKPISGQEIYDDLHQEMAIDLSTIYRNLNILEENHILLKTSSNLARSTNLRRSSWQILAL